MRGAARLFAVTYKQYRSTSTTLGRNEAEITVEGSKLQSNSENAEEALDLPKPYSDKSIFANRIHRNRRVRVARFLAEWKNDRQTGKKWSEIWTAPAPFDPLKVPFDIRMGAAQNMIPKPDKFGNLELVKVQNFLHLTPPTIQLHCKELKKFCTDWPEEITTDEECEREFHFEILYTDYIHAAQSQRNPNARKTTLKIRLCNLPLDRHARMKLIKLAGRRYDPQSDILTIMADRCPIRKQNREYLDYLLTVLYYEAWKVEAWETREYITDQDGIYWWEDSNSYNGLVQIMKSQSKFWNLFKNWDKESKDDGQSLEEIVEVKTYRDAVHKIKVPDPDITDEKRRSMMHKYKESVKTLLDLPKL